MSDDLYATLGVARDAAAADIKRAYLHLARDTHPDKNPADETASARFQAVGRAYATLRDADKRAAYDAAGVVDGDGPSAMGEAQWTEFWNDFFTRVTTEKIDALAAEYRGSDEEAADLRAAYVAAKGDMDGVFDRMMCSTVDDVPRFRAQLQADVDSGALKAYKAFSAAEPAAKQRRRQQRAEAEAKEAEEHARELGLDLGRGAAGGGEDALRTALLARQGQRHESLLDSLAAKYGGGEEKKKKGKKGAGASGGDPLDDAAFEAAQRRMLSGVSKSKKGGR